MAIRFLSVIVVFSVAIASTQSFAIPSNLNLPLFLCKNPLLAKLLSFCQLSQNALCTYSAWSEWQPVSIASQSAVSSCLASQKPVTLERSRNLITGESTKCGNLTELNVTCELSASQQAVLVEFSLGVSFGRPAATIIAPNPQRQQPPTVPLSPQPVQPTSGIPSTPRPTQNVSTTASPPSRVGRSLWSFYSRQRRQTSSANQKYIALILDSSGSVGHSTFSKAVDDLVKLLGFLCYEWPSPIGAAVSNIRFALIVYGSSVNQVFDFAYSEKHHTSVQAIQDSIRTLAKRNYKGGFTATGPALRRAYDRLFVSGIPAEADKRVLLMTDGHSNVGESPVGVARELYNNKGVHVFPVGVGSGINQQEIQDTLQPKNSKGVIPLLLGSFNRFSEIVQTVEQSVTHSPQPCQRNTFRK